MSGLYLNVGSGQRKFEPPFINVDINPKWEPDVVADCASMPMFEDNSADIIVAHHLYEHYHLGAADGMVRECYRILTPSGSLIVTTPNLRELVKAWATGRIDDYIFCVNLYGAYMNDEADTHKWLYTPETLHKALASAAPWSEVKQFDWRRIPSADIARAWWINGIEVIK
jgi:predicted SAM-dependent methyltransferase